MDNGCDSEKDRRGRLAGIIKEHCVLNGVEPSEHSWWPWDQYAKEIEWASSDGAERFGKADIAAEIAAIKEYERSLQDVLTTYRKLSPMAGTLIANSQPSSSFLGGCAIAVGDKLRMDIAHHMKVFEPVYSTIENLDEQGAGHWSAAAIVDACEYIWNREGLSVPKSVDGDTQKNSIGPFGNFLRAVFSELGVIDNPKATMRLLNNFRSKATKNCS